MLGAHLFLGFEHAGCTDWFIFPSHTCKFYTLMLVIVLGYLDYIFKTTFLMFIVCTTTYNQVTFLLPRVPHSTFKKVTQ